MTIGNDEYVVLINDTPMSIKRRWICLDFMKAVVARVQHILPIVRPVGPARWSPLDEEQVPCRGIVAG